MNATFTDSRTHRGLRGFRPLHPRAHNARRLAQFLMFFALLTLLAGPAMATVQDDMQGRRGRRGQRQAAQPPPPTPTEITPKEPARWLAITGGEVHTVSGPVLHDVTILCRNNRIHAVGPNVKIPEDAEILDATGHFIYPGLVAVESRGILGGGSPEDSSDVFDLNVALGLSAGITTVETGNTAAKLTYGTLEDMIVKRDLFVNLNYDSRNPTARQRLRDALDRLREHLRKVAEYEEERRTNPDAEAPDDRWIRGQNAEYLRLLKGEAKALARADDTYALIQLCELAEDYGISIVAQGASEAWTVAPQMARAGVDAIVNPRDSREADDELMRPNGSTIENARILHDHGVNVAVVPASGGYGGGPVIGLGGVVGRDLRHLPMEAAFTVRGGLSNEDAIRTITLDAARILGIDDRVGSIEVGKDADLVITDGDLLHYMSHARWTIVNGRLVYDKAEDTLFDHIRLGEETAPVEHYWPRRLGG